MAWNDKGGGPWGPPPGGGEPRRPTPTPPDGPNDLEALLRRGQDKLRDFSPQMGGGMLAGIIAAAAVGLWLATGIYRVDPNEQAVIQRFGAYVRTESLGLHYHLPAPIETASFVDVTKRNQTEIGLRKGSDEVGTMLTGDSNIVELDFVVVWQVRDPVKYLFSVAAPEEVLRRAAESAMREVIGQTNVQPALNEGRGQIETTSATILQTMLDRYDSGIQVGAIQLQRVDPPAPVVAAFNDVQAARSELEQQRNAAEAYRNKVVPEARGEAQRLIQGASAYKEKVIADATGEAKRFESVLEAYKQSRDVTARRLYLETMESILAGARKTLVDPAVGGKNGILPYLPLQAPAAPAAPAASATPNPAPSSPAVSVRGK